MELSLDLPQLARDLVILGGVAREFPESLHEILECERDRTECTAVEGHGGSRWGAMDAASAEEIARTAARRAR